jgi:uncharacterized protein YsxB (DUF464 family)
MMCDIQINNLQSKNLRTLIFLFIYLFVFVQRLEKKYHKNLNIIKEMSLT